MGSSEQAELPGEGTEDSEDDDKTVYNTSLPPVSPRSPNILGEGVEIMSSFVEMESPSDEEIKGMLNLLDFCAAVVISISLQLPCPNGSCTNSICMLKTTYKIIRYLTNGNLTEAN